MEETRGRLKLWGPMVLPNKHLRLDSYRATPENGPPKNEDESEGGALVSYLSRSGSPSPSWL